MEGASSKGRMRKRSKAWKYFTPILTHGSTEMARCNSCWANQEYYQVRAGSYGTTNLWDHLKAEHGIEMPESGRRRGRRRKQPPPSALSDSEEAGSELEACLEDDVESEQRRQLKQPPARARSCPAEKKVKVEPEGADLIRLSKQIKAEPCLEDESGVPEVEVKRKTGLEKAANENLARMIATHGYEVVEEFMCFVRCLDPDFKLPSREDMEKMWDGILDKERTQLLSSLTREGAKPGRVSFILGTVATIEPGGEATLYTACNFIDGDWNLHRVVADAYMVSELTRDVPDIPNHGFLDNMFMMVGHEDDNIPSSLKNHYGKLLPACPLNQKLLRSTTYIYMDRVLHSVARCLLPCEMSIQTNLLGLSTGQEDPRAYNEQWYSLYCFLKILQDDHSTTTTEATELIGLLCRLWGSIHESIQMISDSTRPTSNLCLAELLNLRKKFQAELTSSPTEEYTGVSYGKTVKDVLRQALKIIDKTIDHSYLVWSIPCILDPRRKLRGIKDMFREAYDEKAAAKYICKVEETIREQFKFYKVKDHYWEMSLDDYLEHVEVNNTGGDDFEILKWWKKEEPRSSLRTLGRMARDFLAMPTCSKLSSKQTAHVRSIIRGKKSMVQAFEEQQEEEAETEAAVVGRTSGSSSSMKKKKKKKKQRQLQQHQKKRR